MNNEPKEAVDFPGFYEIPGFSNYVISIDGEVVNRTRNSVLTGSINPAGYYNLRLTGDDGKVLTWGKHRLMGYVFKNPGRPILKLVINHKNGIKSDNYLDNLEWASYQYNQEHAGLLGLTDKCTPISVRDVHTGLVVKYPSIVKCAREFGVSKDTINWRVKAGEKRIFPEGKQYRVGHDDRPWHTEDDIEKALLVNSTSKSILVKDVLSGIVKKFDKIKDLSEHLSVAQSTLTSWLKRPNQPVLPGLIQLKLATDKESWRYVDDPYLELELSSHQKPVVVFNDYGYNFIYENPNSCRKDMEINTTTLHYRLQSKGRVIYSDGFRYAYYSDFINHNTFKVSLDSNV